jgi:hypothetical protein
MTHSTSPRRRRPVLVGACAAVAAGLVATLIVVLTRGGGHSPAAKILAAPVAKATQAVRCHCPAARPKPKPAPPHDFVAAAAPTSFTYTAPHYTIRATVCGMAYVRPLDPPGEQHHTVCWVQHDFGFAPGSHGHGTTYVLGHSWGQDPLEVLNKISETAMRQVLPQLTSGKPHYLDGVRTYPVTHLNGDVIALRTSTGVLKYTVRNAYAVAKSDAGSISSLMNQHTRNRVVIITCGELNNTDYDYNIIVSAYLTSSRATTSRT